MIDHARLEAESNALRALARDRAARSNRRRRSVRRAIDRRLDDDLETTGNPRQTAKTKPAYFASTSLNLPWPMSFWNDLPALIHGFIAQLPPAFL